LVDTNALMFAVNMLKVVVAQRMSVRYAGWNIFGKGSNKADMYQVSAVESMYESLFPETFFPRTFKLAVTSAVALKSPLFIVLLTQILADFMFKNCWNL